jgi:DNA-binding transcriptional MerR regulator
MAATIDTLKASRRLREANVPTEQAEAMVELLRETQETGLADLVTKSDLQAATTELRHEIAEVRSELRQGLAAVRGELSTTRAELKNEISAAQNRLLMWLLPFFFAQVGALLYLILRPLVGGP